MRAPNPERGEVAVTVGGVDLILCAEMQAIARLSKAMDARSLSDFYQRLLGGEPFAMRAVLATLVVDGDADAAIEGFGLDDIDPLRQATERAILAHIGEPPGKAEAAAGGSTPGRGGSGNGSPSARSAGGRETSGKRRSRNS